MLILQILILAIVLFLIYVQSRPNDFRYERTRVIKASPEAVFEQVNEFRNWEKWSPWIEMEPTAKLTYGENTAGEGGYYRWDGKKTGAGSCTILRSAPNEAVDVALEFERPMKSSSRADFKLESNSEGVKLTWIMAGTNNFIAKFFGVLMNSEKMIATSFDRGLGRIAHLVE
jgi:uncharacterized protein YndB with AHSA1/START domain